MSPNRHRDKPYAVVFAGIPGTSKTPIAHYLSCKFNLPILSTDQIRYEVREDLLADSINRPDALKEFNKRRDARFEQLLMAKTAFILDGSIDRRWAETKKVLEAAGYVWFMINIELTKPFLIKLYESTGRTEFANELMDRYLAQHNEFLDMFSSDINLQIEDKTFADRLEASAQALAAWREPGSHVH